MDGHPLSSEPWRRVSQVLADTFVQTPSEQTSGGSTSAGGRGQYHNFHRSPTVETNRDLFEESQRRVAAAALTRAYCLACCMLLLQMALVCCTILMYVKGYLVYFSQRDKACDQPLSGWLLVTLVVFPVRIALDILRRCLLWASEEDMVTRQIGLVMTAWQMVGNPVMLFLGLWWLVHCKTCQRENPQLHDFVKFFYVYQVVQWIGTFFVWIALTSLLLWMQRRGLLDSGPGQHAAASPGVINKIETVVFSPELFSSSADSSMEGRQPPECCVCQGPLNEASAIKRTPCGHFFHEECLGTWLGKFAKTCPLCRTNLEDAVEQALQMV